MNETFKTPLQIAKDVENQARLAVLYEIHLRDARIKTLEKILLAIDKTIPMSVVVKAFTEHGAEDLLEDYVDAIVKRVEASTKNHDAIESLKNPKPDKDIEEA